MTTRKVKTTAKFPETSASDKRKPSAVDVHVGVRLRQRRSLMGFSQEKLAESIGLTFQQIQKYERGMSRISASRLYQFSKVLDVPISYFYENYSETAKHSAPVPTYGFADNEQESLEEEVMEKKETLELVRTYYSIVDPKMRKDLLRMIRTMAENMRQGDS